MKTRLKLFIVLGILTSVPALPINVAFARLGAGIQVLKSDETGITVEVRVDSFTVTQEMQNGRSFHLIEVPGFATTEEEGLPQLPYTSCLVAVPFGSAVRFSIVTNETATRTNIIPTPVPRAFITGGEFPTPEREFTINEDFYRGTASFPPQIVKLGEQAGLRHQRVVPIHFFPFQFSPSNNVLTYSKRLVVRIDFGTPSQPERVNLQPAPSFELYSEGLYQGLLLNYDVARSWRMKPLSRAVEGLFPVAQAVNEYKMAVDSTAAYRVSYSSIPGLAGSYPIDQVRLFEKFYEEGDPSPFKQVNVPIHVVDTDSDGLFDNPDYFVFYGMSFRDRFPADSFEARYSYNNVYWITVGNSGASGSSMRERDSWRPAAVPQQPSSFLYVQRFEKDLILMAVPPREDMDYYFWKHPLDYDVSIPFPVYAPDTTQAWRIRARYVGQYPAVHYITMMLNNNRGQRDTLFNMFSFGPSGPTFKAEALLDTGFNIPNTLLASGSDTLRWIGQRLESGILQHGSGAYFDWFEVSYYKKYIASNGVLTFNSGTISGELEFSLAGFPSRGILLYDVTDSLDPVRLTIQESQITPDVLGYRLTFRDSVGIYPKRYVAITTGNLSTAPPIELDSPSSLATTGNSKDYFIVTYDGFAPFVAPLVTHRESLGHKVELAKLSDVFDEFNGGRRSARAIRRYMRYAFNTWGTPMFLLLVGDASEDYKGVAERSEPDFLPTYLTFSPVIGPEGAELAGNEQWYVTGLEGVEDDYPDMYVGRLSVEGEVETSALVQKIIAYETFPNVADFRGRGLFVSDDDYSSTDLITDRLRISERVFKSISSEAKQVVDGSPAAPGFVADTFYLGTYLDSVPTYPKPASVPLSDLVGYVRVNVTPKFLSKLSDGNLFVNFQGHGNQSQLAHEKLLVTARYEDDSPAILNYGKPWVLSAFSCHIGDFDSQLEGTNGECLAEKLLLLPSRGAIAVFSSDAFENLPINNQADMNVALFDAFFGSPPTADLRGKRGARWLLGEIVASGKIRFLSGDYSNKPLVRTYGLLGDPGLRMDALPPQFQVAVNDSQVTENSNIYAPLPDDSVRISAYMNDEVAVNENSISIEESGEGARTILRSEYTITALADTVGGAGRKFYVYFPTVLRVGNYDITIHATDVNNRETIFPLKVEFKVTFSANGTTIHDNDFVPQNLPVTALVTSPIVLSQDALDLFVNNSVVVTSKRQLDPYGRSWQLDGELFLPEGADTVAVKAGGVERTVTVNVTQEFSLRDVFSYPSPFDKVTSFNYSLTGSPQKVLIEIFTVSGRKILEISADVRIGYNTVIWDGRDAEGNRIANGLYFYRLTATEVGGKTRSFLGKVVKVE